MSMKKFDRFGEDLQKLLTYQQRLSDNLQQKKGALKTGEPTGKYDYLIQSSIDQIEEDMKSFEKLSYLYENEPHQHPDLSQKERQKRINKIAETRSQCNQLIMESKSLQQMSNKQKYVEDDEEEARNRVRLEDGEYEDTKLLDERQLITKNKKIINEQDKQLAEIEGIVKTIRLENQNFTAEVTEDGQS
eukprot:403353382